MKRKQVLDIVKWTLLVGAVVVVFGFSTGERRTSVCRSLEVNVEHVSGVYFIDESVVIRRIFDLGEPIVGAPLAEINLSRIRRAICEMPSVKEATVYPRIDGRLMVNITQRRPLFRVIGTGSAGYYIDTQGKPMPLSSNHSANVPVVTGKLPIDLSHPEAVAAHPGIEHAFSLVQYIEAHSFISSLTEHLIHLGEGEFELVPRVGSARILIGQATDLDSKFERLQAFYLTMTAHNNINKYKRINLKYRDQVVCERFF